MTIVYRAYETLFLASLPSLAGKPTTEIDAFVHERPGMTLGWTGSFDALEALLDVAVDR